MSKSWIRANIAVFARDVLRDFCIAADVLERLFEEFDGLGRIDFDVLRELIGEEMNKGLLWRLKDTAHHLFRNDPDDALIGKFLDWAVGYIFHESMKLKEDAYQLKNYAPWFAALTDKPLPDTKARFCRELSQILGQTRESVARETGRIRFILHQCKGMFPYFYAGQTDNPLLARFLFEQGDLFRAVFGERLTPFLEAVYGAEPEMMYVLAAKSLREGGWFKEADQAAEAARSMNPNSEGALREKRLLVEVKNSRPRRRAIRPPAKTPVKKRP